MHIALDLPGNQGYIPAITKQQSNFGFPQYQILASSNLCTILTTLQCNLLWFVVACGGFLFCFP